MVSVPSFPPNLRALVVDDEPAVRLALDCAMQDEGWQVRVAESAEEALALFERWTPDVILADKNMPGTSGIDLLREIRRTSHSVAFVLMTGYGSLDSLQEATHLDVDGYLEKPFRDVYGMLASVREVVARRVSRNRFREAREHFQRAAAVDQANGDASRPAVAVMLPEGSELDRVTWALEPLFATEAAFPALEGQADQVLVAVCNTASLVDARQMYPHAFVVALAASADLSSSLTLVDQGANLVVDPTDSPETVRLSIERAVWLAEPITQVRRDG